MSDSGKKLELEIELEGLAPEDGNEGEDLDETQETRGGTEYDASDEKTVSEFIDVSTSSQFEIERDSHFESATKPSAPSGAPAGPHDIDLEDDSIGKVSLDFSNVGSGERRKDGPRKSTTGKLAVLREDGVVVGRGSSTDFSPGGMGLFIDSCKLSVGQRWTIEFYGNDAVESFTFEVEVCNIDRTTGGASQRARAGVRIVKISALNRRKLTAFMESGMDSGGFGFKAND